jgi:hypothetical protein
VVQPINRTLEKDELSQVLLFREVLEKLQIFFLKFPVAIARDVVPGLVGQLFQPGKPLEKGPQRRRVDAPIRLPPPCEARDEIELGNSWEDLAKLIVVLAVPICAEQ